MANIKTDELSQFHEYNVYTPARLIYLEGDIDKDSAGEFIRNIRLMDHVTDKDITVLINSEGGDVYQALAIIDSIKECNSRVITHAVGPCYSSAAWILQSGDLRKISSNSRIMVHIGEEGYSSDHPNIIKKWIKENERVSKTLNDMLLEKIKIKKPRFTKAKIDELLLFDTIFNATESIEIGLADEIVEHKEFKHGEN